MSKLLDRSISNERLGEAGETLFANLGALAGLDCNRSDRDRTGWDFTVEFASGGGSLDQRRKTIGHIQVKATTTIGSVPLSLSSAGMLAMGTLPAFVVMFRMDPTGAPLRGYLIHLIGDALARVLRRMREAQALGRHDINKLKVTFDHRKFGTSFNVTPDGLRDAIEAACGPDPLAYSVEKARQLEALGYEDGGVFANAHFRIESEEHLYRVLFGLDPLRAEHLEAVDVRFGIPIPYTGDMFDAVDEIMLSPPSAGMCQVSISGAPMTASATFRAELHFAPPIDRNLRMLVRHKDFTLTFRETSLAFESTATFRPEGRPIDELVVMLRGLAHLASGNAQISISDESDRFGPLRMPVAGGLTGPYLELLPQLAGIAADWQTLLELAGIKSTAMLTIDDVLEARWAHIATDLVLNQGRKARLAFDAAELDTTERTIKALMVQSASIRGEAISYAVEVELTQCEDKPETYSSTAFRALDVRRSVPDMQDYLEEIGERLEFKILIHPDRIVEVGPEQLI